MIIKRALSKDILKAFQYFPVIAILGPRQSGKTTLAKMTFPEHAYVSLEDLDERVQAQEDPRTFLLTKANKFGLIIDEFQYEPNLLSYIQTMVDESQRPGFFILTGSQNFLMNQAITQSLAGRISIHTLLPLSIHELKENNILPNDIETMLHKGCYPAIYSKNIDSTYLYKNYVRTYIERDVRELTHVGDLTTFQTFMTLCATRMGQLINYTSLGNECGLSDTTIKRWLTILEASYIVFPLYPYHTLIGKRLVKTAKLFFYDPGLAAYLAKIKIDEVATHPLRGGLFESFIISDILKWYYNQGEDPRIYFWRDKTGNEIDCIIDTSKELVPVEIKSGRTISPRFFEGLSYWNELDIPKKHTHGYIIFTGSSRQRSKGHILSWQSIDEMLKNI